jgi:hypothetical protein
MERVAESEAEFSAKAGSCKSAGHSIAGELQQPCQEIRCGHGCIGPYPGASRNAIDGENSALTLTSGSNSGCSSRSQTTIAPSSTSRRVAYPVRPSENFIPIRPTSMVTTLSVRCLSTLERERRTSKGGDSDRARVVQLHHLRNRFSCQTYAAASRADRDRLSGRATRKDRKPGFGTVLPSILKHQSPRKMVKSGPEVM